MKHKTNGITKICSVSLRKEVRLRGRWSYDAPLLQPNGAHVRSNGHCCYHQMGFTTNPLGTVIHAIIMMIRPLRLAIKAKKGGGGSKSSRADAVAR